MASRKVAATVREGVAGTVEVTSVVVELELVGAAEAAAAVVVMEVAGTVEVVLVAVQAAGLDSKL